MGGATTTELDKKRWSFLAPEIWVALVCYFCLTIPRLGYVPLWDSMENLEEYLFVPRSALSFDTLLLMHNGHPSLGYFWPFWIGQWLFPTQILVVHVINLLIGSLAIISFGKIAATAFNGLAGRLETALITVAFAIHPVFVAYAINMSPDYGVLAYFLATLWLVYTKRWYCAALTGSLLIFSKEIGVPTYLLLVIVGLIGTFGSSKKPLWPLSIPIGLFGLFCAYQKLSGRPVFPWSAQLVGDHTFWNTYFPNPFRVDFKMACLGPFVMQFQWVFAAVIVIGLEVVAAKGLLAASKKSVQSWINMIKSPVCVFLFLLIGCLYIDSRVLPYTNQRYVITLYPLILLLFLAILIHLTATPRFRIIGLVSSVILLLCCNFWTLDPVSKSLVGTFTFGKHSLLSVAKIRPERAGYGRDQLVYNLQHTYFADLLDSALEKIKPNDKTVIAIPSDSWWVISRLDGNTYHRTESRRGPIIRPIVTYPSEIISSKCLPDTIYAFPLPNLESEGQFAAFSGFYDLKKRHLFSKAGYELAVLELSRKPGVNSVEDGSRDTFGLATWNTQASFTNVVITNDTGILYQSDFRNSGDSGWRAYRGEWRTESGVFRQTESEENCRSIFVGATNWNTYTISLKARKDAGKEGFLVIFNWNDAYNLIWWNIGGWLNSHHVIERTAHGQKHIMGKAVPGTIEPNRWYDVRIVVRPERIQCYLDGKLVHDVDVWRD